MRSNAFDAPYLFRLPCGWVLRRADSKPLEIAYGRGVVRASEEDFRCLLGTVNRLEAAIEASGSDGTVSFTALATAFGGSLPCTPAELHALGHLLRGAAFMMELEDVLRRQRATAG